LQKVFSLKHGKYSEREIGIAVYIAIVVAVLALALITKKSDGWETILLGLFYGCQYSLIAMGLSVIYSSTRVINFAQGEFAVLGGLLFLTLSKRADVPMLLAFIIAALLVALVGAGFERLAIHRVRNSDVIMMIIMTIGFSIFLRGLMQWIWGGDALALDSFSSGPPFHVLGAVVKQQAVWVYGFTVLIVLLVYLFFNRTIVGKGMSAAASNPDAASLTGISLSRSSLFAWIIAAALGAMAGMLFAPVTFVKFDQGVWLGIYGFAAAVMGGMGDVMGAVVGGLSLGILEYVLLLFVKTQYQHIVVLSILIVVILLRPQGILGRRENLKV
jgi:branched-chain amino acid transport system permease protein